MWSFIFHSRVRSRPVLKTISSGRLRTCRQTLKRRPGPSSTAVLLRTILEPKMVRRRGEGSAWLGMNINESLCFLHHVASFLNVFRYTCRSPKMSFWCLIFAHENNVVAKFLCRNYNAIPSSWTQFTNLQISMKFVSKYMTFRWSKGICNCRLQTGGHFVSASVC